MATIPLEKKYSELRRLVRNLLPVMGDNYEVNAGCGVLGPSHFGCTRKKGHEGPHLACGTKEAYEIWENESEEVREGRERRNKMNMTPEVSCKYGAPMGRGVTIRG